MLGKFYINKDNIVSSHLASDFKLSAKQDPFTDKEKRDMVRAPYSSTIKFDGNNGVVSQFLSNPY